MDSAAWLRPTRLFAIGVVLIVAGAVASFQINLRYFGANFSSDDGADYALYVAVGTTVAETLRFLGIGIVLIGLARLVFPIAGAAPPNAGEGEDTAPEDPELTEDDEPETEEVSRSAPESLEFGGRDDSDAAESDDAAPDRFWARRPE